MEDVQKICRLTQERNSDCAEIREKIHQSLFYVFVLINEWFDREPHVEKRHVETIYA